MPDRFFNLIEHIDLQFALLVIGAILIFSLLAYNLLRTSMVKKQLDNDLTSLPSEENTDKLSSQVFVDSDAHRFQSEPSFDSQIALQVSASAQHSDDANEHSDRLSSKIDPNIDCVVVLKFDLRAHGSEILEKMSKWPKNSSYHFFLEGHQENASGGFWEIVTPDHLYQEIQLSMQLANRRGPISQDELADFLGHASELAQQVDAEIDLPPIQEVLAQALDLDSFAVQCDVQLGLNVVPNMMSWESKDVEMALLNHRFLLARDGSGFNYFVNNHLLFKAQVPQLNFLTDDLQNARIKQILFSLEVPLVPMELNPLTLAFEVASQLAKELDGKILDDNGRELDAHSIHLINDQLQPIYGLMQERQILPGTPSAHRLFS
jgi:hypothetical protein